MSTKVFKITILERKVLIKFFDDIIADMISNEKLHPVVTELFIRGRKLNISLVFIKGFESKHYTRFHYEDSEQTKASTKCF